jgi:hypothetical protein
VSRTYRRGYRLILAIKKWRQFRHMRTHGIQAAESASCQDMLAEGLMPRTRIMERANRGSGAIPSSWVDKNISAMYETDSGKRTPYKFLKARSMNPRLVQYQIRGCRECPWNFSSVSSRFPFTEICSCEHPSLKPRTIDKCRYNQFPDFCPLQEAK